MRSGEGARGGRTRGDPQACAHAWGRHAQDIPGGMVKEDRGQLPLTFGRSCTPSAGIVDGLEAWGAAWEEAEHVALARLPMHRENGSESSGKRPPVLQRMVACCDGMGTPMQLRYSPPSHSQDHPMERCWGMRAWPWQGTKLVEGETMGEGAKTRTWQGMPPIGALSRTVYQKGVALRQRARQAVEARLARHPELPQWDILIQPVSTA